jgi:hypothetical protein
MAEMVGLAASEAYPAAAPVPAVMTASSEVRVYAVARGHGSLINGPAVLCP